MQFALKKHDPDLLTIMHQDAPAVKAMKVEEQVKKFVKEHGVDPQSHLGKSFSGLNPN